MSVANLRSDLLCAWCGSSLLIVDIRGGCDHPLTGFYHRETRTLCDLELRLNGQPAWLCEAAAPDPRRLEFSYVYPEVALYGGGGSGQSGDDQLRDRDGLPQRGLLINVEYRVNPSSLVITAQVTNVSLEPLACELRWRMGADFADIQEAQGRSRRQQATVRRVEGPSKLTFTYEHPQLPLQSEVDLDAAPEWRFSSEGAATQVSLSPGGRTTITLHVHGSDERGRTDISDEADRGRAADAWRRQFTRITAPHIAFERSLAANVRDLASFPWLQGPPDEWLTLQAGIPFISRAVRARRDHRRLADGARRLRAGASIGLDDRRTSPERSQRRLARRRARENPVSDAGWASRPPWDQSVLGLLR